MFCTTILVAGCAKATPPVAQVAPPSAVANVAPPPPPPPPPPPAAPPPAPAATLTEEELFARKTLEQLNAERPLHDALFDFDRSLIREDAQAALRRNAEWLRRWGSTTITVEGHADERGTTEYNLALGDRRANSARAYLLDLGISPGRIVAVTKGEESPACVESAEPCWQQNRRAHPIITAK
jgi:peptidoglycan-associated lipoprotein